jgi:hypothetical protein
MLIRPFVGHSLLWTLCRHNKYSKFRRILVGLSSGNILFCDRVGDSPNSYAVQDGCDYCWLSGNYHTFGFKWPYFALKPKWNGCGDVIGCGLVLNTENKMSIFFTLNGILMGLFLCDS